MIRRLRYWLWRVNLWRTAHLLPEWHRFYQTEIRKRVKAHRARRALQTEYTRRVHEALRRELSK